MKGTKGSGLVKSGKALLYRKFRIINGRSSPEVIFENHLEACMLAWTKMSILLYSAKLLSQNIFEFFFKA